MLTNASIGAFVATADSARAREFYEKTLGLEFVSDEPYAVVFNANGTTLRSKRLRKLSSRHIPRSVGMSPISPR